MATNIVEAIQKALGFATLQKIDPNTQDVIKPENLSAENYLPQAAIPTILLGFYKFSQTTEGNAELLKGELSASLLQTIFHNKSSQVVEKVATYTGNSLLYTEEKMEVIGREAIKVIRSILSNDVTDLNVKNYLADQRHNILVYLPASLHIGEVLKDSTTDDQTNKMEGPVSNTMHWLEKLFPSTDRKKEENF